MPPERLRAAGIRAVLPKPLALRTPAESLSRHPIPTTQIGGVTPGVRAPAGAKPPRRGTP